MSNITNETKAIFANLQESFETASPDQGMGSLGEWPTKGEHACYVLSMDVGEGKFRQTGDQQEFPALSVQFHYQLCEDPDRTEPLIWNGAPMVIPNDPSLLTHEGSQIRAKIELGRLKGHLKTIIGRDPNNLENAVEEVDNKLKSDNTVACMVICQYTQRGETTYKSEKLKSLLSI
ncbi:TPA: hypothetical protein HA278_08095 [Candidatus Woesearchaeota archaeon]|nr:hypothetical protein [Candidatus Woesearchaeota archaeon]